MSMRIILVCTEAEEKRQRTHSSRTRPHRRPIRQRESVVCHIKINMHAPHTPRHRREARAHEFLGSVDLNLRDHRVGVKPVRVECETRPAPVAVLDGAAAGGGVGLAGLAVIRLAGGFAKGAEAGGR